MARRVAFTTQPIPSLSSLAPLGELTSGQQYTRDAFEDIIRRVEGRAAGEAMKNTLNKLERRKRKRKRKPRKKRCRGVFLKGNPSVLALLKRIPALSVKVRDLLPSSDEGTCISRAMSVASLLRRIPTLKRKLYTLFPR